MGDAKTGWLAGTTARACLYLRSGRKAGQQTVAVYNAARGAESWTFAQIVEMRHTPISKSAIVVNADITPKQAFKLLKAAQAQDEPLPW